MPLEAVRELVRVVDGSNTIPLKVPRLVRVDRIALLLALFIAVAAVYVWGLGIIGLWGKSQFRFADAMIAWMIEAELALVLPAWLLLRIAGALVRAKARHDA